MVFGVFYLITPCPLRGLFGVKCEREYYWRFHCCGVWRCITG